jgi:hypothetical protein
MNVPTTQYTSLDGADIAYQVMGQGPPDLVYVNGLTEHIDVQWDHPLMAPFPRAPCILQSGLGRLSGEASENAQRTLRTRSGISRSGFVSRAAIWAPAARQ